jgi:hypothetical protein
VTDRELLELGQHANGGWQRDQLVGVEHHVLELEELTDSCGQKHEPIVGQIEYTQAANSQDFLGEGLHAAVAESQNTRLLRALGALGQRRTLSSHDRTGVASKRGLGGLRLWSLLCSSAQTKGLLSLDATWGRPS